MGAVGPVVNVSSSDRPDPTRPVTPGLPGVAYR